jgi:uncharacterized protein (PEP-CTERM system associated)
MHDPLASWRWPLAQPLAVVAAAWAACGGLALAQEAPPGRGFVLTPTLSAETSYLETRGRITGENGREAVLRVAPGLRLASRGGSVQGTLDYTGNLIYRRGRADSQGGDLENTLNAAFLAEAVSNFAFVDARASVSQQSISAFGQQSVPGSLQSNANRTEVATANLSPYLRGSAGGLADYEVRLTAGATKSRDAPTANARTSGGSVLLQSARGGALLGWALNASQQRSEFTASSNGAVDDSRLNATVSVAPAPELRLSASGGRESVDQGAQAERRTSNTAGLGLKWLPSPRTNLDIDLTDRFFGRAGRASFSHRSPRTVWTYSLSRDTSTGANGVALGEPLTLFQLFYNQAASAYPDPVQRQQVVLDQLNAAGLDPNQLVATGVLTSSYSLLRRQDASVAWLGLRTTLTVQAFTSAQSQFVSVAGADPAPGEAARQHGYSSSLSYRLTPQTSVAMGGSRTMTFPTSLLPGTDLKSANLSLTSQVGRQANAQLGARYTVFNSVTDPYRETSLSASLNLRF